MLKAHFLAVYVNYFTMMKNRRDILFLRKENESFFMFLEMDNSKRY